MTLIRCLRRGDCGHPRWRCGSPRGVLPQTARTVCGSCSAPVPVQTAARRGLPASRETSSVRDPTPSLR